MLVTACHYTAMGGKRRTLAPLTTTLTQGLREYSEASTIHGISYAFSSSLPFLDRLLWTLLTLTSLGLAVYWSVDSFNTWQDNPTITTLTNPTKSIASLPFPAVTICTDGLDMAAVEQAIIDDFAMWKKEKGKTSSDKEEDRNHLQEFMETTYKISDNKNIFDIIKAFHSPSADESAVSTGVLDNIEACRNEQNKKRRKRSVATNIKFLIQETGYKYYKVALPQDTRMTRDALTSTCGNLGMHPVCNESITKQMNCVAPTFSEDPFVGFSKGICSNSYPAVCTELTDLFLYSSSCPWSLEGCKDGLTSTRDPLYAACVAPTGENTNTFTALTINPEVLHSEADMYLRVPVRYGEALTKENVESACTSAGLTPLCRNDNQFQDACSLGGLEGSNTVIKLSEHLCPDIGQDKIYDCPLLDGLFFMSNDAFDTSGVLKTNINGDSKMWAKGSQYTSGWDSRPLYAACIKEGGRLHHIMYP